MTTARRSRGFFLLLFLVLLGVAGGATAQDGDDKVGTVNVVRVEGGIDAAYAAYITNEIEESERRGDIAVVLQLIGSGAIKVDVHELVGRVFRSEVPVAAWVGPVTLGDTEAISGAHTSLWLAAGVRFVAHGAEVGSVTPARPGGRPRRMDCANSGFVSPDESVQQRLCSVGGRLTAAEVIKAGLATAVPRAGDGEGKITEGTVNSVTDVVRALHGKSVKVGDHSRTVTIDLGADRNSFDIRNANPGLITRVRQALATNPTLVYLLLLVGAGAVVFELFQPGFGPAGYSGLILLALAAYGLVALPTNPVGLALTMAGLLALAVDVGRGGLGALTWGGTVALAVGSRLLIHSDGPALTVPWAWVAFGVVSSWVFYVVVMTVVLRALRGQSAQLGQALLGRVGEVRSTLNPQGHVLVEGALWRARALEWDGPVGAGTRVTVTGVDEAALILDVVPVP
jgi:membrane-bound serine protease (ClpP class)